MTAVISPSTVKVSLRPAPENGFEVCCAEDLQQIHTASHSVYVFGSIAGTELDETTVGQIAEETTWQQACRRLNGHFAILVLHHNEQSLRLLHSRSGGCRPYFFATDQGVLWVSNRLEFLAAQLGNQQFDAAALSETLQFRWLTSNKSLLAGISVLQAGDYLAIDKELQPRLASYWQFPIQPPASLSHQQAVEQTQTQLKKALLDCVAPSQKPAVLLSAGVDSSLLAALLKEVGIDFIAYSHNNEGRPNPELETAQRFAAILGAEHRVIEVRNDEIEDLFNETTAIIEQPIRAQSDLLLLKLFKEISKEHSQIVYGEAADTLFGTAMVKRFWQRYSRRKILNLPLVSPALKLVFDSKRVDYISNLTPVSHHLAEQGLEISAHTIRYFSKMASGKYLAHLDNLLPPATHGLSQREIETGQMKRINLRGDVSNHFHSACSLARHLNLEIISPFADHDVMETAAALPHPEYFGGDYVKPVLRSIGERFYPKEMMHLPKLGFPAPHTDWINAPLSALSTRAQRHFDPPQQDAGSDELKWTLMSLLQLQQHWNAELPKPEN